MDLGEHRGLRKSGTCRLFPIASRMECVRMPSNESSSAHEVIVEVGNASNLEVANISKCFSGVKVLEGVSFDLRKGERHALVGENGFLFYPQGKG
jgi:ABC-type glutathione transport system ATPase component